MFDKYIKEVLKKYYWKKFKRLETGKMCLAAILIDGYDLSKIEIYEKRILNVGENFGGVNAGYDLGERMFFMSKVKCTLGVVDYVICDLNI